MYIPFKEYKLTTFHWRHPWSRQEEFVKSADPLGRLHATFMNSNALLHNLRLNLIRCEDRGLGKTDFFKEAYAVGQDGKLRWCGLEDDIKAIAVLPLLAWGWHLSNGNTPAFSRYDIMLHDKYLLPLIEEMARRCRLAFLDTGDKSMRVAKAKSLMFINKAPDHILRHALAQPPGWVPDPHR